MSCPAGECRKGATCPSCLEKNLSPGGIDFDAESVTSRGFRIYAKSKDAYGADVSVVESSEVEPGIWIQVHPGDTDTASRVACNILFSPEDMMDLGLILIKAGQEKRAQGM